MFASQILENSVDKTLRRCSANAKRSGKRRWEFTLANGKLVEVTAQLSNDWLTLDASLPNSQIRGSWFDLAQLNLLVEGSAKCVLKGSRSLRLRTEIHLIPSDDLDLSCEIDYNEQIVDRLQRSCEELKAAIRLFSGDKSGGTGQPNPPEPPSPQKERTEKLRGVCVETGWVFNDRAKGSLVVELDAKHGFYQATVEQRGLGAQVSVEVARSRMHTTSSVQALSALLLETGGLVKLARPSVAKEGDQIVGRFDVRFGNPPAAVELRHAFSALSVACSLSGREATALLNEKIAAAYLSLREFCSHQSAAIAEPLTG